ncbi:hypothetical protein KI387_041250, partial [Taxus chinensis]
EGKAAAFGQGIESPQAICKFFEQGIHHRPSGCLVLLKHRGTAAEQISSQQLWVQ